MATAPDMMNEEPVFVDADAVELVERRQHERLNIYLRARWEGLFGRHEGTVSDISAGGCFILCEKQASRRELIRLEIELHDGEWVKMWAEVSNKFDGVGFGVKYTEVDGEDEDRFSLSLEQTKSIRAAVAALKKVSRSFVDEDGEDLPLAQVDMQEYKSKTLLALHKVNKSLLDLPECRKKTALRLSVQAYADLYRVWAAMRAGAAGNAREWAEAYKCLKKKYGAPEPVLESVRRADTPAVLTFLRNKAHIYLTFVS
jgi:hypothetical protein